MKFFATTISKTIATQNASKSEFVQLTKIILANMKVNMFTLLAGSSLIVSHTFYLVCAKSC